MASKSHDPQTVDPKSLHANPPDPEVSAKLAQTPEVLEGPEDDDPKPAGFVTEGEGT